MPFSNIFSPVSLSGIMQGLGLVDPAPTGTKIGGWKQSQRFNSKVDNRLTDALSKAAEQFAVEHPGYTVEATSGYRPGDKRQHGKHRAIDVHIKDPSGAEVPDYQSGPAFRTYESLAQNFKSVIDRDYPELADKARWGGYFSGKKNYGAVDLMHFDLGGFSGLGMAGGSWANGLNATQRGYYPDAVSIGMGMQAPGVPTPTARPDSPSDLANIASLNSFQDQREYERPSFAAPLGQVERAALPDLARSSPSARVAFDAAAGSPISLPPDRQMPSGPISAPQMESLPPDRQMPSGPVDVSTSFAPPASSFPERPGVVAPNTGFASPARPDNLDYAGPKGMFGVSPNLMSPEMMAPAPAFGPPTEVADYNVADVASPVPGAPASPMVDPTGQFPDAPAAPSTWDHIKYAGKPMVKDAMLGLKLAGPLGAIAAPAIGILGDKLGIGFSHLGPGFDNAVPQKDRFSTGTGLSGILGALSGPKGAQGFSLSNPGMSVTSLGNGQSLRRSEEFGWTEVVGPDGQVQGIHYDKTPGGFFGSLFGGLSKSMNDKFGGGGSGYSPGASKAISEGKGGLY